MLITPEDCAKKRKVRLRNGEISFLEAFNGSKYKPIEYKCSGVGEWRCCSPDGLWDFDRRQSQIDIIAFADEQPKKEDAMKESVEEIIELETLQDCEKVLKLIIEGECQWSIDGNVWNAWKCECYCGMPNFLMHHKEKSLFRRRPSQLLVDAEEIMRCRDADCLERLANDEVNWVPAHPADVGVINENIHNRKWKYRLKPGCTLPPKEKKVVVRDRTPEELTAMIGLWMISERSSYNIKDPMLLTHTKWARQYRFEIAPIGTNKWRTMQITEEV